jgi:hypothetical protein
MAEPRHDVEEDTGHEQDSDGNDVRIIFLNHTCSCADFPITETQDSLYYNYGEPLAAPDEQIKPQLDNASDIEMDQSHPDSPTSEPPESPHYDHNHIHTPGDQPPFHHLLSLKLKMFREA